MIHDTIKQRLRASLLLAPPPKATHTSALRLAASLREDGTWDDLPSPASALSPSGKPVHLDRTLLLAKAHRTAAGALDDPLRRALDLWLANDFSSPDWRHRHITVPRLIGEVALLYDNGLSAGAAGKVMEILARSRWAYWAAPGGWVDCAGMDLLGIAYNHLLRGCMENAPSFFDAAFGRIFREIRQVQPDEEGIQADMTYRASVHGHTGGGGLGFMRECAQFIALAHGTPWQAPVETVKLFVGFLLDGQQWMMRQETVDADFPDDVFTERADLEGIAAVVQQLAQLGNPPRRLELAAFAHRLQGRGEALSGHRYFWRARLAVHQRPAFYASLRLSSSPVADGRLVLLRSSREYHALKSPASGGMMPGTTTPTDTPENSSEYGAVHRRQPSPALSGDVNEGDYGLAVTELQRSGLTGKKAWFFFDESVVCLGTDLHHTGEDHPVRTTVNHCRLLGPVVVHLHHGEALRLGSGQDHSLASVRRVDHDGVSYVFPEPASVFVRTDQPAAAERSDPAQPSEFRLELDHSPRPRGASWSYVVMPAGDDPDAPARVEDEAGRIEILANHATLQAVRHRGLGLLGVAFWVPGVVMLPGGGRVAANHPCLLLCREDPDGGTRLSISNLSGRATAIHVEYGGQCVCFETPGGPDAGRSVSRLL